MVPEIWSTMDKIFCHFGSFFCLFTSLAICKIKILKKLKKKQKTLGYIILHRCTINDNHMMYGSWDMEHDRQIFLSFWTIFLPFYPPKYPENQNFEKILKMPENITFTHVHYMMYGIWDMEHEVFVILGHFLSF